MNDNKLTDKEITSLMDAIQHRIDRFLSEGQEEWSKKNLSDHFNDGVDLDDDRIQAALRGWEKAGIIQLIGREDVYFKVLKPFP
jgi:hypothetical protein